MDARTRIRPRVDRPSRTNESSIAGGIFGTDPTLFGGGLDGFLSRVEQAEQRDATRMQQSRPPSQQNATRTGWAGQQHEHDGSQLMEPYRRHVRRKQDRGAIQFGDDSSPQWSQASMYQTTNSVSQQHMQEQLRQAHVKQEERTLMELLTSQHGLSRQEARHEIDLYRREQAVAQQDFAAAAGGASPQRRPAPAASPSTPATQVRARGRSMQPPWQPQHQPQHEQQRHHLQSRPTYAQSGPPGMFAEGVWSAG